MRKKHQASLVSRRITYLPSCRFSGHTEVTRILAENGAELDLTDKNSQTPLHLACFYGKEQVAQLLVQSGCNPELPDSQGQSPADVAQEMGNAQIAQFLQTQRLSQPRKEITKRQDIEGKQGPVHKAKSSKLPADANNRQVETASNEPEVENPKHKKTKRKSRESIDGKMIRSEKKKSKSKDRDSREDRASKLCCVIS